MMANCILQNKCCQFWTEVKKVNSMKCKAPTCMDGITGKENSGDVFVNKYSWLYNCVSYDEKEMEEVTMRSKVG